MLKPQAHRGVCTDDLEDIRRKHNPDIVEIPGRLSLLEVPEKK